MSENIIVTGASSGIGRALAIELAAPGKTLYLFGLNAERLREAAGEVRHRGASCIDLPQDLTRFEECETRFAEMFPPGTEIDALYHCVGRATFGELQHTAPEDLTWIHQTNLLTTAHWISLVYPRMVARRSGRIVLLSSLSGYTDLPMCASYAGTKRAMLALAHGMAPEARNHNVRFTVCFPGFIKSRIFDAGRYHELSPERWEAGVRSLRIPFLSAEKAARVIVRGARRGKARVIFPFYAKLLAFLSFRVPLVNGLVHRFFLHQLRPCPTPRADPFAGKTIVRPGTSAGLGRAATERLLARGATGHGLDRHPATLSHESVRHHDIEVAEADSWQSVANAVFAESPQVDILINNAGISLVEETHALTFEQWRRVLDINFLGTMLGTRAFYPQMIARKSGHIVNVASVAGAAGYAGAQAYAASKGAILSFSRSLRHEAQRYHVRVTTACPGYVDTAIYDGEATPNVDTTELKGSFPVPLIPTEKAAGHLLHGIARGRRNIVFPFSGKLLHLTALWAPALLAPIHRRLLQGLSASRTKA